MSILVVAGLTYDIKNKKLYSDANFVLNKEDHMGIVGQNGTGKTTLINLLINKIEPASGSITWQKGVKIGYLDQHAEIDKTLTIFAFLKLSFKHLFDFEKELNDVYEKMGQGMSDELSERAEYLQNKLTYSGFYDIESTIQKIAAGLGISALGMETLLANLSGGQRAKVILAKLLLECPDVLLMDEPTNFLDKEHVEWLIKYLKTFEGAYIIISHDHYFLNEVTNCIIDIEFQTIKRYTGNFQQFLNLKEENRKNYSLEFGKQQREIEKLKDYIAKNGARASTARMAQSRQKKLDKMDVMPPAKLLEKPNFIFNSEAIGTGTILKAIDLEIGYERVLLPPINLNLNGKEKIVITGFNGIGKSTLIKTIVGKIPPLGGTFRWENSIKVAYFEQDLVWKDPNATAFTIIKDEFKEFDDQAARKWLAQCAIKGKISMQPIHTLSGGEQVKVKLCILMLKKANVLILDEPTNHIDVDSKEVLKEQLKKWQGSIILISHEHTFYEGWVDRVIKINKK
ncbi:MAG: ATP-binding cassette domain-containing protein [Mycoplasmataceae bacterium]|nr:ATP-binding cassette domain-containing protein [Mycoplasmataceae bacterium]